MDRWDNIQRELMRNGGNKRLHTFFVEQGIADWPIQKKYSTKAALYYKEYLLSKVHGLPSPTPLKEGEGKMIPAHLNKTEWSHQFSTNPPSSPGDYKYYHDGSKSQPRTSPHMRLNDVTDTFHGFFQNAKHKTKEISNKTMTTIQKSGFIDSAKTAIDHGSIWVGNSTRNIKKNLKDEQWWKSTSEQVSHKASSIQERMNSFADQTASQAYGWWNNITGKPKD